MNEISTVKSYTNNYTWNVLTRVFTLKLDYFKLYETKPFQSYNHKDD